MANSKEVQRVQDDVKGVIAGLDTSGACLLQAPSHAYSEYGSSSVQNRWFRYKPKSSSSKKQDNSPMPSPEKQTTVKRKKRTQAKRKTDAENEVADGAQSDSVPHRPPPGPKSSRRFIFDNPALKYLRGTVRHGDPRRTVDEETQFVGKDSAVLAHTGSSFVASLLTPAPKALKCRQK
ncbi:hypothetical protein B0H13DRAFT_1929601 [Mycena leptocephala]|nr:hypothetical protein B0H13DRAFT_1929601 [Mycena leptocephala]